MKNYFMNRRQFIKRSALSGAACMLLPNGVFAAESFMEHSDYGPMPVPAPDWLRNAVIAEVPTRGFNVSDYKHLENWKSPYGDTTYRSIAAKLDYLQDMGFTALCIYSVYNCTPITNLYALKYHEPNPDMGTLDDATYLMDQVHSRGMHIMSNTNHYGVALTSPLLTEHPDWFLPASQQVSGQRIFDLGNPEARAYIIDTHAWWCTDVGLDGWRIDLGSRMFKKSIWSAIVTRCADKGKRIMLAPENRPLVGFIQGSGRHGYPPILDMQNSTWMDPKVSADDPYRLKEVSGHNCGENHDPTGGCAYNTIPPNSCEREGCFRVKRSQFIYGHNSMFAPMLPWMLVGETFDATHLALPIMNYTPKMLHSWLDWTEVAQHQDVVDDFRRIGKIRAENQDIFNNNMYEAKLINVPYTATPASPVNPYVRYISGKKACIVIGNNSPTDDVTFTLRIPLAAMGMDTMSKLYLTDCWADSTRKVATSVLGSHPLVVPKDKSRGGGVRVLIVRTVNPAKHKG